MSTKTVRVRIAVAVLPNGEWNTAGWSTAEGAPIQDEVLCDTALEPMVEGATIYFVEADVPLPKRADTFEGHVVSKED